MTIIQIRADLNWRSFRGKGGNWIAVYDPLGLTVQSDTWAHLMEDIAETLNAVLLDVLKSGELQTFLQDRGWGVTGPIPVRKRSDLWFDVPFKAEPQRDSAFALH